MIKNVLGLLIIAMASMGLVLLTGCPAEIGIFSSIEPTLTVTFDNGHDDTDGYTSADPALVTVNGGGYATLPATNPTRTGYVFICWYTVEDDEETDFTETTPVTANITVYAKWVPGYTVTFDKNDGSTGLDAVHATINVISPATTVETLPANPTRTGDYVFDSWYIEEEWEDIDFTESTEVTENITVYARWVPGYTVTFDKNDGSTGLDAVHATVSVIYPATTVVTLPETSPTWAGHAFDGWYTVEETEFLASTPVTESITVYAKWMETYTVTFNRNDGSTGDDAVHDTKNEIYPATNVGTLPLTDPTRADYVFDGWYTEDETEFLAITPVNANITVYARWKPCYTVTFDKNDGSTGNDAVHDTKVVIPPATTVTTLPANPTRTGYTFAGSWTTEKDGTGSPFTTSTPVDANITVYAQWTGNTFSVTFNSNYYVFNTTQTDGNRGVTTSASTQSVTYPNTMGTLPKRDGYDFDGWNSAADGTGTDYDAITPIPSTTTVYAKWKPKSTSKEIKYGTPTINGATIDPLWADAVEYPIDKVHEDSDLTSPNYLSTSADTGGSKYCYGIAKALWDDNGLWVFVRVADNKLTSNASGQGTSSTVTVLGPDRHDSVEVLINEATIGADLDISQTAYVVGGNRIGGLYRVAAKGQRSTDSDPTGAAITNYTAFVINAGSELAVDGQAGYGIIFQAPWAAKTAYPVGNGKKFGLELQINACRGTGGSFTNFGGNGRWAVMVWNSNAVNNAGSLTTGTYTGSASDIPNVYTVIGDVTNYAEMTLTGKP